MVTAVTASEARSVAHYSGGIPGTLGLVMNGGGPAHVPEG